MQVYLEQDITISGLAVDEFLLFSLQRRASLPKEAVDVTPAIRVAIVFQSRTH